jgi:hypothetical protein
MLGCHRLLQSVFNRIPDLYHMSSFGGGFIKLSLAGKKSICLDWLQSAGQYGKVIVGCVLKKIHKESCCNLIFCMCVMKYWGRLVPRGDTRVDHLGTGLDDENGDEAAWEG